jgi:hypothetical protein
MKQFIVLLAVLPLMLGLIMQIGLAQGNFALTVRAESIVRDCREYAAASGGFTDDVRREMTSRLADAAGEQPEDISLTADAVPDADGALRYRVGVPEKRLTAAPSLFGTDPAKNSGVYVIEGVTRVPAPDSEEEPGADGDE